MKSAVGNVVMRTTPVPYLRYQSLEQAAQKWLKLEFHFQCHQRRGKLSEQELNYKIQFLISYDLL